MPTFKGGGGEVRVRVGGGEVRVRVGGGGVRVNGSVAQTAVSYTKTTINCSLDLFSNKPETSSYFGNR